jgi:hypothetical protein
MSDQNFPGFIDDPAPAAPKPAASPAPAPAAKAPAVAYQLDMGDPEPEPKKRHAPPPPVAPAPAPRAPVKGPAPIAPAPEVDSVPDEDIKPGARKDLWSCPHCGTKNQPQRSTCRSCGKSPQDEVIVPVLKRPLVIAGLVAGVVLVLALIFSLSGTNLALRDPTPENVDAKLRSGSGKGNPREVAGTQFTPSATVSVCGRVAAASNGQQGVVSVVLALGRAATDDEALTASSTTVLDGRVHNAPEPHEFLHLCFDGSAPTLAKGSWLSLVGERGELADRPDLAGGTVIVVSEYRQ